MYSRYLSLFVVLACTGFINAAPIGDTLLDIIPDNVLGKATPNIPTDLAGYLPGLPRAGIDSLTGLIPGQVVGTASNVHLPKLPRSAIDGIPEVGELVPDDDLLSDVHIPGLRRVDADALTGLIPANVEKTIADLASGIPLGGLPAGTNIVPRSPHSIGHTGSVTDDLDTISVDDIPPRDEEHPSLPEIFKGLAVKIGPVADQLKAAVSVKAAADIDGKLVVGLLNEVINLLTEGLEELQFIVDNPTGFVLSVAGTILSIKEVSFIVSTVFTLVIPSLFSVVAAVEGATADLVLPLIATIGSLVASLLSLALALVPGLLALLFPLITNLVSVIYYLRLADVVAILGLPALA